MATFEQRESGYWQAKVRRKGWPAQSKTFRTKTAAENWARQVEAEMDRGAFVSRAAAERTTFAELAQRFRSDFAPHHYRSTAWKHKLARLEARLGEYSLAALTPERVGWYRDARLQDRDPRFSASDSAPRVTGATGTICAMRPYRDLQNVAISLCLNSRQLVVTRHCKCSADTRTSRPSGSRRSSVKP